MSVEAIAQEKSSCSSLVRNAFGGCFLGVGVGIFQGAFGSLAIPSSVRNEWNNRDVLKHDLFDKGWRLKDKVANWGYNLTRLPIKFGGEGYILYKIAEDLVNGDGVSIGLLAIPNIISVGYEVKRARDNYRLRKEESVSK